LERAQRRRRLARVEDGDRPAGGVHELARERGDAREPLQEIEGGALRGQHRRRLAVQARDDVPRLAAVAVLEKTLEAAPGIELQERFGGDVEPGDDARA